MSSSTQMNTAEILEKVPTSECTTTIKIKRTNPSKSAVSMKHSPVSSLDEIIIMSAYTHAHKLKNI